MSFLLVVFGGDVGVMARYAANLIFVKTVFPLFTLL